MQKLVIFTCENIPINNSNNNNNKQYLIILSPYGAFQG